jgi:hypothetical protein
MGEPPFLCMMSIVACGAERAHVRGMISTPFATVDDMTCNQSSTLAPVWRIASRLGALIAVSLQHEGAQLLPR